MPRIIGDGGGGPPGSTGTGTAAPSFDGEPGQDGFPGAQGPAGVAGATGETGPQGPAGAAGVDGEAGQDGFPGAAGPPGVAGAQGPAGAMGFDGADGAEGIPIGVPTSAQQIQAMPLKGVILTAGGAQFKAANIPQFNIVQGTNAPVGSVGFVVDDVAEWAFPARAYQRGSDITCLVNWYAAATTNATKWEVALGAVTNGDAQSLLTKAFATATSVQTTVSGTTNARNVTTITITGASLDSLDPDDYVQLQLKRITSSSEMTGQALMLFVDLRWP